MARSLCRWSVVLGVFFASSLALASEPYPDVIARDLSIPKPLCTICHLTLIGGENSIVEPFGLTAKNEYGLGKVNLALMSSVLKEMEADGVDSDGDGIGDIAELRAGSDPNDGPGRAEPPRYGLFCSTPPVGAKTGGGALWFLGAAAIWFGRRRSIGRGAASGRDVG